REVGHARGEQIADVTAETETDDTDFSGLRPLLEKLRALVEILLALLRILGREQRAPLVLVAGITADRAQRVGPEGDEVRRRQPPHHILDIGIEATVLVD